MSTDKPFEAWALIELFGHQRLAGLLSEQTIGGCSFLRIDVPEADGVPAYTRLFGEKAVYSITITDEATARALAAHMRARPVQAYEVPRLGAAAEAADRDPAEDEPRPF